MSRNCCCWLVVVLVLVSCVAAQARPPMTVPGEHIPNVKAGTSTSRNWGGYAVTGPAGSVTEVQASWVVPEVTCRTGESSYSSFWTGIDGYGSRTVEQTGTDSDCRNGTPTYYAWYEFYPRVSRTVMSLSVAPGDIMSADVRYDPERARFVVSLANLTRGGSFTITKKHRAARSSAEWIAEAPASSGGTLPLADFGTVDFGGDFTGVNPTCYASVGGTTGPIAAFGASVQDITMVSASGAVKAQPSGLSTNGTSFSVTWASRGP